MSLTKAQKRAIVREVLHKMGTVVEFWSGHPEIADIPAEEGRAYVAALAWDTRLGDPERRAKR